MTYTPTITIGNATLIHGDCYENLHLRADAIVTDPPYEFDARGGTRDRQNMKRLIDAGITDGFDLSILNAFGVRSCVTFCHENQLSKILLQLEDNFDKKCTGVWIKSNPPQFSNHSYIPDKEFYIHAWNKVSYPNGKHIYKNSYWVGANGADKTIHHPCVKPLPLMQKIMTNVNGDVIVDPFMGSGTTGIAALDAGKTFIGIEKNEKFFEIAVKRITDFHNQLNLFSEVA